MYRIGYFSGLVIHPKLLIKIIFILTPDYDNRPDNCYIKNKTGKYTNGSSTRLAENQILFYIGPLSKIFAFKNDS